MKLKRKNILAAFLVALMFICPNGTMADEFKLIPSIAVRGEFNDNIFYSYSDTEDDFITTISPGLELVQRTEQLDLDLSATVSPFFYADNSELDDVDQNYWGKFGYKITPLLKVNADALYDVSNRPDRDIETTGLVESNDKRKQQKYGLGLDYTITEITAMALSFGYLNERWDTRTLDRQDLDAPVANLSFTQDLSKWWESTIGRLNFGFGRYEFETSDTYNYFASIGAQHWFSETINLVVDLGVRYSDSDYLRYVLPPASSQVVLVEDNNTGFGGVGQAILEIKGELTRSSLRIAHDIRPASGRSTTVERSDVVLNLSRKFAEKSVMGIAGGFYKNKADSDEFSSREIDEDTFFVRPRIRWEFYDNFTLEAAYHFVYIDDHVEGRDKRRNLVYFQVAYGLPLFE